MEDPWSCEARLRDIIGMMTERGWRPGGQTSSSENTDRGPSHPAVGRSTLVQRLSEAPAKPPPLADGAKDGKMVDREPDTAKRKERAGWSDPKSPSRGWQVDEVETGTSPFYVSSPLYGDNGSSTKAAKLRDTPGEWTTDKNVGAEF